LSRLETLATHEDPDVRESVAHTLGMLATEGGIPALLRLMQDPVTSVRDWATFALGTLHQDVDTPEIREALFARIRDADAETRGEALVGLARRADPRAVELIREDVRAGEDGFGDWAFQAAELTGDRSLLPDLESAWARRAAERHPRLSNALADAIAALRRG
jgi:HEAT repeat protein